MKYCNCPNCKTDNCPAALDEAESGSSIRYSEMVRHSQMLGQIANEVERWCINDQATTLDAVQYLKADWMRLKGIVEMNAIEKRLSA